MTDPCDDDVVDPFVRVGARLAREDPNRRAARRLRAARRSGHHLAAAATDDRATALGQKPAELLRALFVLCPAADDRNLFHRAAGY